MSALSQQPGSQRSYGFVVVDEEDRRGVALRPWRFGRLGFLAFAPARREGKPDREGGPLPRLGSYAHGAAQLPGDAVDGRQAESRPSLPRLRRKEGLENPVHDLRRDPDARIGDFEEDIASGRKAVEADGARLFDGFDGSGYPQFSASGHRVPRVEGQVEEYLLDLSGIREGSRGASAQGKGKQDILGEYAAKQPLRILNRRVEIQDFRREGLAPREGQ